jgi:leader peptidase (prepilin peptidase)/N-methyltransferase
MVVANAVAALCEVADASGRRDVFPITSAVLFKLLAALGAWMGWMMLPLIVLLSSVVGATVGLLMIALKRHHRDSPIPFGPFLATAGLLALLIGQPIINSWLAPY